jgi:hypothetical protein
MGLRHNATRINIDEMTSQLVRDLQQNDGLEPLGKAEQITVGSVQGRSVMFHSPSPIRSRNWSGTGA